MRTSMLAEPIVIIIHGTQKSNCWIQLIQEWMSIFSSPKMGKRSLKKCKPFLWELTLPVLSVCMGQWWQGSLVRPPSWKTWSLSWGNIEEWPPPTRRQVLSRVVGLRRIEKLEGEKGWWPGGWNSLDKGSALTQVGYCSANVLNCETSLCTVVGVGIVTK